MSARVSSGPQSRQDYETPRPFIAAVERRWGPLTFDLAATHESAKAPAYYGPGDDSLRQPWPEGGRLWLNPPFTRIGPWASKSAEHREPMWANDGRLFLLVPASIGARWFERFVLGKAFVLGLIGRLKFDGKNLFPKDCMLCVYGEPSGFAVWDWRKGGLASR